MEENEDRKILTEKQKGKQRRRRRKSNINTTKEENVIPSKRKNGINTVGGRGELKGKLKKLF